MNQPQWQFSIGSILALTVLAALAIVISQKATQPTHFTIDFSGPLVDKLHPDTVCRVQAIGNPNVQASFNIRKAPFRIPDYFLGEMVDVEFLAPDEQGIQEVIFGMEIDRELFDQFRPINLKLDAPDPVLRPFADDWTVQQYSANITKRMRYTKLPYWDQQRKRLAPLPSPPRLVLSESREGNIIDDQPLGDFCFGRKWFSRRLQTRHRFFDGDRVRFSVVYDSGGLFETKTSEFVLEYQHALHGDRYLDAIRN